ncbi:MAG: zinc-dependent peptidase [Rhodoferax sp.]|nr:zinc-dependent peptidase [Rhodoferax sp.]
MPKPLQAARSHPCAATTDHPPHGPLSFLIFSLLALAFVVWLLARPWLLERRRARLRARPFPAPWRAVLQRLPFVQRLPADLQLQLKAHIQVFLAEKPFIACGGIALTDAMRVTIAAQACVLLLNRDAGYFPSLRQILVYPGPFVVARAQPVGMGVIQDLRQVLSGESWSQGQVILSWQDVENGISDPGDGRNVVIHEFAHQLDQESGQANGAPALGSRRSYRDWSRVFGDEFAALQQRVAAGHAGGLLSDYGATNPGEFFAVASEAFFEQAQRMAQEHPALFAQLRQYYCVDPLSW